MKTWNQLYDKAKQINNNFNKLQEEKNKLLKEIIAKCKTKFNEIDINNIGYITFGQYLRYLDKKSDSTLDEETEIKQFKQFINSDTNDDYRITLTELINYHVNNIINLICYICIVI